MGTLTPGLSLAFGRRRRRRLLRLTWRRSATPFHGWRRQRLGWLPAAVKPADDEHAIEAWHAQLLHPRRRRLLPATVSDNRVPRLARRLRLPVPVLPAAAR